MTEKEKGRKRKKIKTRGDRKGESKDTHEIPDGSETLYRPIPILLRGEITTTTTTTTTIIIIIKE